MPFKAVRRIYDTSEPPNEIGIEVVGLGNNTLPDGPYAGEFGWRVLYADIPGNSWNANRLAKFVERAQQLIDFRQPLADLPADDPDKTTDPATPFLFWDGTDIVARSAVLENVSWDGESLQFTVRRAS